MNIIGIHFNLNGFDLIFQIEFDINGVVYGGVFTHFFVDFYEVHMPWLEGVFD
ncbi:hypothetical protein ACSBR2_042945 [Camellia fascicularis]